MPELPEVESVRRTLENRVVGRSVVRVRVLTRPVVSLPGDPASGFTRTRTQSEPVRLRSSFLLARDHITTVERLGKQIAIVRSRAPVVRIQLGMTGSVRVDDAQRPKHTHVEWELDDGACMRFVDPRRFGLVASHPSRELLQQHVWSMLGPDALTIRHAELKRACVGRKRSIKSVLLDQTLVAGVGNIYADEALFASKINPTRDAGLLTDLEVRALAREIRSVMRTAIKSGGSTIRDYRNADGNAGFFQQKHKVYGRGGDLCTRCQTTLQSSQVAQRTTVWCPRCQMSR